MEVNYQEIKENIILYGEKIGIDGLGFLKAESFFPNLERLNYSKKRGYLSTFINKEDSKDFLKDYKTIVCILVSYPNPLFNMPKKNFNLSEEYSYGKISASSWGIDYHKVLTRILEDMVECIKKITKLENYHISVDINPLSERELAVKAGLGWIGKNSNLINKELGSFVFIGELYLDFLLPINKINLAQDLCGDCNLCVESCPVSAIEGENRVINTKLCLSQQTQEKDITNIFVKNKIKETKYIFGCDICQEVCPWNNKNIKFNSLFQPIKDEVYIDLKELSQETNKTFKKKYGHLSGSWRGKNPWQNNGKIISSNFNF